ncbi:MAG: ParB/RepB/Spo0J family partition protein [Nitrospirae bacterium]|nr:ParB/RepB/Spo0J family partition protein [Nitrospirota bacterium]MDA1304726.1 ParB/RepB/Spo0J family partition protein [Nitrospirota bacterium]
MEKRALGKGLGALLPGHDPRSSGADQVVQLVPINQILPNQYQPRKRFPEEGLDSLAESIRQNGILQPILVRRKGDGIFELIAGERRFRAAKLANLSTVPVIIRNSKDDESAVLALVENIQRKDLNSMEEAKSYTQLIEEFGLTQEMVADRVGRERSSVANILRLVSLPNEIQLFIENEQLSLGHAKVILGIQNPQTKIAVANKIIRDQLSVRAVEQMISNDQAGLKKQTKKSMKSVSQSRFANVEEQLRKHLGTKVVIRPKTRGGELTVTYYSDEDLTRITDVILS